MTHLALDSRLAISSEVVAQELEGETVLLSLDTAEYYGLNATGTRIWQWIVGGASLGAMAERLAAECRVDPRRAQSDVLALAESLLAEGLVTLTNGAATS